MNAYRCECGPSLENHYEKCSGARREMLNCAVRGFRARYHKGLINNNFSRVGAPAPDSPPRASLHRPEATQQTLTTRLINVS